MTTTVDGMKVYMLHLGDMWSDSTYSALGDTGATVDNPNAPHRMVQTPSTCFLIDHPQCGWILFDTGMPDDPQAAWPSWYHAGIKWTKPEETKMVNQLAKVGVKPEDIKYVVSSHLHFDHIGGDCHFAKTANFIVSKADAEHAYRLVLGSDDDTQRGYYIRGEVLQERKSVRYIEKDTMNLFPGIDAYILPGHTPGILALHVHLKDRDLFLAEDALNEKRNYWNGMLPGGAWDTVGYRASVAKMHEICDPIDALVVYGHDFEQFCEMKKAPEFYE